MNVKIKRSGIAALFIAATVGLAGCGVADGVAPSQATCIQFLTGQQMNQPLVSYSLLSTPCKNVTTIPVFKTVWATVEKKHGKIKSWSQSGLQLFYGGDGKTIFLRYALSCTKGNASIQFGCIEENHRWMIQSFHYRV